MDARDLHPHATDGISVGFPEEHARFDDISTVHVALAPSIHDGNIVQATGMGIHFDIV